VTIPPKSKAFTLIELLVVIAIIAILAAIVFPVFTKARERAKCSQCISNLKQIGVAAQQYIQDSDGRYPYAYEGYPVIQGKRPAISQVMASYTRGRAVWQCPSDSGEIYSVTGGGFAVKGVPFFSDRMALTSYDYFGVTWPKEHGGLAGTAMSDLKNASLAVFLIECRPWHDRDRAGDSLYTSFAKLNVLHCDGHVDRRTRNELVSDARKGVGN